MSKILILVNHEVTINTRMELVKKLLSDGHKVVISLPKSSVINELVELGCECREIEIFRHSMNPLKELKLFFSYNVLIKTVKPDIIFSYTIKPNIYGGMSSRIRKVPFVPNVTGLGTTLENPGLKQKIILMLYRIAFKKAYKVFFQNTENQKFMLDRNIIKGDYELLPGSGVNLQKHCLEEYPENSNQLIFLVIGRIMKDKGTDEILYAAKKIKEIYPDVVFRMIGFHDGDYEEKINEAVKNGCIEYFEHRSDMHSLIKNSHATIHASYHEGMANVLLETAASGRPVIATDVPGCRETYENGVSGIAFKARDGEDLVHAIREFIELPYEKKKEMGVAGRKKMEEEFDRQIVVQKYIDVVNAL